ncbi:putative 6-phosphogluconolactonase 4, chloroplastic [Senna tora]|uniref:Putative 6-phosphogluconolactonase 4, chloroplastic n=1 Tax=Senna tora TaxID=362788 RepID=A0A834U203_9FABA|nr:putative 6-phosphogluconolactonase 4, chloroplastic [Senna tora]
MATSSPSSLISHTLHSSLCSNSRQYKSSSPQHALSFPTTTTSLILSSIGHKSLCPSPLRYNNKVGVCGINPKRLVGRVKASKDEEGTNKNIAVLNKDHLAVSLAKYVADLSNQFIHNRKCFTLVLSAHSVKKLVEPPYINSVEWSKWHIFWVDERVVPKTHVDSNYKLAYDRFLSKVPIPAGNINTIDDSLPADVYETTLRRLVSSNVIASSSSSNNNNNNNGLPKFDLILLDMGPDGEVGSLFPGHPALNDNKHWITFLNNAPDPPRHRITMTLPLINACSNLAMVVTGAGKANAVHSAVMGKGKLSDEKLPVQLVKPLQGEMKWFLDKGAASKLYNY